MKTICFRIVFCLQPLTSVLVISLLLSVAFAQENMHSPLLNANEDVLISFAIEDSPKILTVATAKDGSYIVYRFGQENNVELEYPSQPQNNQDSWGEFTHKLHNRGVGEDSLAIEISYLEFSNYGFTYRVYDAFSAEFSKSFVGVIVVEHATGNEYDIQAIPESKLGGLDKLNAYSMIQVSAAF